MSKKIHKDLYQHSVNLGIKSILTGNINKESIKRLLCPMDVSRYYELPAVIKEIGLKKGSKILDVSSPKLITSYLSSCFKDVKFWGIDKYKDEINIWSRIVGQRSNLKLEYGDALSLKYPDNFFNEVYSVSVIEHVGNGRDKADALMLSEIYRVLKRGGRLYLTTIISSHPEVIYKSRQLYSHSRKTKNKTFFCKIYDYSGIRGLLSTVPAFKIVKEEICNYRFPIYEKIFNSLMPLSIVMGPLNNLIAPIMVRKSKNTSKISRRAEYFCILEK